MNNMFSLSDADIFGCLDFQSNEIHRYQPINTPLQSQFVVQEYNGCNPDFEEFQSLKKDVDELGSTSINEDGQLESIPSPPPIINSLERQKRDIQCPEAIRQDRSLFQKGLFYETQNIGKHLKTITKNYLFIFHDAKYFERDQSEALFAFSQSNGALRDFHKLLEHKRLRQYCKKLYHSNDYIISVLSSPKMDTHSKIMMIKYAERFSTQIFGNIRSWKKLKQ